eukprot:TRINITY_DN33787_c0_g1_i1.p1 TRINITY_DN33787_c0_g1~~TRINITY_DN33787_c0_g1_i1.p1  ORF type:complete len:282 (-),score=30.36 TRINITY_DN33787_c0_g1_i1:17-826(-)
MLTVTVISASNLKDVDSVGGGLTDAYVKLTVGQQMQRTKTVNNNLNPQWNERFTFRVNADTYGRTNDQLTWELKDDDVTFDKSMGRGTISLAQLQRGVPRQEVCRLTQQGELYLELLAQDFGADPYASGAGYAPARYQQPAGYGQPQYQQYSDPYQTYQGHPAGRHHGRGVRAISPWSQDQFEPVQPVPDDFFSAPVMPAQGYGNYGGYGYGPAQQTGYSYGGYSSYGGPYQSNRPPSPYGAYGGYGNAWNSGYVSPNSSPYRRNPYNY